MLKKIVNTKTKSYCFSTLAGEKNQYSDSCVLKKYSCQKLITFFKEKNNLIVIYEVSFYLTIYSGRITYCGCGTIVLEFASEGENESNGASNVSLQPRRPAIS